MSLLDKKNKGGKSLRFPSDKVADHDDYMMFTVYEYQPPFRKANCIGKAGGNLWGSRYSQYDTTGFGGGELKNSPYKNMILYMPEDINDSHTRSWAGKGVTNLQRAGLRAFGAGLDAAPGLMNNLTAENVSAAAQSMLPKDAAQQGKALLKQVVIEQASAAAGVDPSVAFGGVLGQVANPNLEVMFDSVGLREFSFGWTMVPRNQKESLIIKEMIWQFKKASAPSMEQDGWFMKVPNVFKIEYKQGSRTNHWLNKMKACALTSVNVNYTSGGNYATYADGAPIAVSIGLSFKELKMVLSQDFGDSFSSSQQYY